MRFGIGIAMLVLAALFAGSAAAQSLDGSPYDPARDPDIDLFMTDWRDSTPAHTHGALIERAIFTRGNNPNPVRKGAVLEYVNRYVHATLPARAVTTPVTLNGEQEIVYILDGTGTISGAKETFELGPGAAVLVPAGLEFVMRNPGPDDMTMYLVSEPIPAGFRPNDRLLGRIAGGIAFGEAIVHWSHLDTVLFQTADGLGTLENVTTCTFSPMTIGHPHSHEDGTEEAWTVIRGANIAMLGKQIRRQGPGDAYLIPNDGKTPHSNINVTDDLLTFFYFARYRDHEVRP